MHLYFDAVTYISICTYIIEHIRRYSYWRVFAKIREQCADLWEHWEPITLEQILVFAKPMMKRNI